MSFKVTKIYATLLIMILVFSGCNSFSEENVLIEFKETRPEVKIYERFVGEGDNEHAYIHFRYTLKNSTEIIEEVY